MDHFPSCLINDCSYSIFSICQISSLVDNLSRVGGGKELALINSMSGKKKNGGLKQGKDISLSVIF